MPRVRLPRLALPDGVFAIALSCAVSGAAAWAFLVVTARVLGPARFTPLSQLWTLALLLAPGTFLTVEQEVTRAVSERVARRDGYSSVVRQTGAVGAVVCVVWAAVVLAAAPFLVGRLFDHQVWLLVGLLASLPSYLVIHLTWGILAGSGRFRRYAWMTAGEGLLRLALCLGLVLLGVRSAGPFGVVVGVAPLLLVLAFGRVGGLRGHRGTRQSWVVAARHVAHLIGGSLFNQILLLVPPLVVDVLARPSERVQAGRFVVAMVLVRVPLFLFNAVLAPLLAQLSRSAALSDRTEFTHIVTRLLSLVTACAVGTTIAAVAAGAPLLRLLFGPSYALGTVDLGMLAAGCGVFMIALTLGQALIAQAAHFRTTIAWGAGLVAFSTALIVHTRLTFRVETAFVAGCCVAAVLMGWETLDAERRIRSVPPQPSWTAHAAGHDVAVAKN